MSTRNNKDNQGQDGTTTKLKGMSQQSHQKGADSVGKHDKGKHKKDESDGSEKNTTKKGPNNV